MYKYSFTLLHTAAKVEQTVLTIICMMRKLCYARIINILGLLEQGYGTLAKARLSQIILKFCESGK